MNTIQMDGRVYELVPNYIKQEGRYWTVFNAKTHESIGVFGSELTALLFARIPQLIEVERSRAEKATAELAHTVLSLKESTKLYENMRRAFLDSQQSHELKNLELAALKELHRWREWPDERPDEGQIVLLAHKRSTLCPNEPWGFRVSCSSTGWVPYAYWREIVGPEEGAKQEWMPINGGTIVEPGQ